MADGVLLERDNVVTASTLTSVMLYVWSRAFLLETKYPVATAWYASVERKPGSRDWSMHDVILGAEYPALSSLTSATRLVKTMDRDGAYFLIRVVQAYSSRLTGVHWNGSALQLKLHLLPEFAMGEEWWSSPQNPWGVFSWSELRPALSSYLASAPQKRHATVLHALFEGGLCLVAERFSSRVSSARELMSMLFSHVPAPPAHTVRAHRWQRTLEVYGMCSLPLPVVRGRSRRRLLLVLAVILGFVNGWTSDWDP